MSFVRIVGVLLFLAGAAASASAVNASFSGRRAAWAYGLAAPLAVLVALTGALLLFIPGFLG